ncbi:tetratricopeptide-like helical domain, DYW domain protein [Tanacetum coccineum]
MSLLDDALFMASSPVQMMIEDLERLYVSDPDSVLSGLQRILENNVPPSHNKQLIESIVMHIREQEKIIQHLKASVRLHDHKMDGEYCTICMQEYEKEEWIGTLDYCRHEFHADCVKDWLLLDKCHGHILRYGFLPGYTNWSVHEENSVPSQPSRPTFVHETSFGKDEIRSLVRDALGQIPSDSRVVGDSMFEYNIGESSQSSQRRVEDENVGIRSLVRDALGQIPSDSRVVGDPMFEDNVGESSQSSHRRVEDENVGESSKSSDDSATYKKLLEECDKELYPGCKYSNLSFTLHLYHVKCIGGVSNKTFGMFLELIRDVFPHLASLPSSVSKAKKLTKDLGLGYEKIDACPNDCMLY